MVRTRLPPSDLRLIVITDRETAAPRSVESVVREALEAGAPAVQLRMKRTPARELLAAARRLRKLTRRHQALLFVNDRVDVALASGADGVHLGPDDLPVGPVRRTVGEKLLVGYSTDDPHRARRAEEEGADYIGCGSVWPTASKDVGDESIGLERLDRVARAVSVPVVAIGGVTPERAGQVAETRAAGCAVIAAVMGAPAPREVTGELLGVWGGG